MDSCWIGSPECGVDWQAWGAIFTAMAAFVALFFGTQATRAERRRIQALRGVYASGIQLRLRQFIAHLAQIIESTHGFSSFDPSPEGIQRLAEFSTHPRALFKREEVERIATVDPELAGTMSAMLEGIDVVSGYVREVNAHHGQLTNIDRMRKMARASELAREANAHAERALDMCEAIVSHRFSLR